MNGLISVGLLCLCGEAHAFPKDGAWVVHPKDVMKMGGFAPAAPIVTCGAVPRGQAFFSRQDGAQRRMLIPATSVN